MRLHLRRLVGGASVELTCFDLIDLSNLSLSYLIKICSFLV